MSYGQSNFMKRIQEDLAKYQNRRKLVRSSLIERLIVRRVNPKELHPNPDDEFSDPNIGPCDEVISKYAEIIRNSKHSGQDVFDEPISVQRMKPDGYMILNGHHRWAAAIRMGYPSIRIHIENPKNAAILDRKKK